MKYLLRTLLCILMIATLIPFSVTAEASYENYSEDAYSYLQYIDENLRERIAGSDQEKLAAEYFFDQFESFGYTPVYHEFNYSISEATVNSQNLIVTKPGRSEKTIIVGAHYDSVDTAGVDDNGSGVSVVLETAKRMNNVETPYTVKFILFGAEEDGLFGSQAYVESMTEEDIANTLCMINIDSVFAGTYRYIYSGTVIEDEIVLSWPFYQAMAISDEFGLNMRSNDTPLNYDYPSPTTGDWSDHQSFRDVNIPYLFFEAVNWELLDDPEYPEYGSSGAYETETGEVMHVNGRDDLTFIETEWGTRGKDTVRAYCILLHELLLRIKPAAVFDVIESIGALPKEITAEDAAAIKAVDDAYNALSDSERSLVSEDVQKALFDAKAALTELNEPADGTSPNTWENGDLLLWFKLLSVGGLGTLGIVLVARKRKKAGK